MLKTTDFKFQFLGKRCWQYIKKRPFLAYSFFTASVCFLLGIIYFVQFISGPFSPAIMQAEPYPSQTRALGGCWWSGGRWQGSGCDSWLRNWWKWWYSDSKKKQSCFPDKTLITMVDYSQKTIKEIKVGDLLLSYEPFSRRFLPGKVTKTFVHQTNQGELLEIITDTLNLDNLKVTPKHPIYLNGLWQEAGKAKTGDILLNEKGQKEKILSVKKVKDDFLTTVYNLQVEPTNTYFVQGILVHNKKLDAPLREEEVKATVTWITTEVRRGPDENYPNLDNLVEGDTIEVLAKTNFEEDGTIWVKVKTSDGVEGWVRADSLDLSESEIDRLEVDEEAPKPFDRPTSGFYEEREKIEEEYPLVKDAKGKIDTSQVGYRDALEEPYYGGETVGYINIDDEVKVKGRDETGEWLLVEAPEDENWGKYVNVKGRLKWEEINEGWVEAFVIKVTDEEGNRVAVSKIPIVENE